MPLEAQCLAVASATEVGTPMTLLLALSFALVLSIWLGAKHVELKHEVALLKREANAFQTEQELGRVKAALQRAKATIERFRWLEAEGTRERASVNVGPELRTMAVQSQCTYTSVRKCRHPRFLCLEDALAGARVG